MAQPVGPSFIAKAALTTGRALHQPFEIPTEFAASSYVIGGVTHQLVGDLNAAARSSFDALQPRGPAKLFARLFDRVDGALESSTNQAMKATNLFWKPFAEGSHQIGFAVANPFAAAYASRVGFATPEDPAEAAAMLAKLVDPIEGSTKFPGFLWPMPKADDGAGDAGGGTKTPDGSETPETPKTPDGSETPKAPDGTETPETPKAPDGTETPETPETPKVPDGTETPETPKPTDTGSAETTTTPSTETTTPDPATDTGPTTEQPAPDAPQPTDESAVGPSGTGS